MSKNKIIIIAMLVFMLSLLFLCVLILGIIGIHNRFDKSVGISNLEYGQMNSKITSPLIPSDDGQFILLCDNYSGELVKLKNPADIRKIANYLAAMDISSPSNTADKGSEFSGASEIRWTDSEETKYTYIFYSKGIEIIASDSSEFYPCAKGNMAELVSAIQSLFDNSKERIPTRLGVITPQRYESMKLDAKINRVNRSESLIYEHSLDLFKQLSEINVIKGSLTKPKKLPNKYLYKFEIKLNTDVVFNIVINDGSIYIESSNYPETLKYTIDKNAQYEEIERSIRDILDIKISV